MIPQAKARPFLLRDPEHFKVAFEINPWMSTAEQPDPDKARQEWDDLALNLAKAGGTVHSAPSDPDWPDMVFPTDTAVVSGGRFLLSRFSTADRAGEARLGAEWLTRNGWTEIRPEVWPLAVFLAVASALALTRYRRTLD